MTHQRQDSNALGHSGQKLFLITPFKWEESGTQDERISRVFTCSDSLMSERLVEIGKLPLEAGALMVRHIR